jgi:hypothetical protein
MLNKAKSIDPEITLKREDSTYKRAEEFGSLLGYPRCCIRKFILRNRNSPKPTDFSSYILDDKKDFRLNNFFHNGSNYYLSFHYPCSLHCKKSIKYNNEILEAIEEEEPKYALMIKKYLKLPLMVWFSVRKMDSDRWPDLFDNRRIVLFYGKMKKNSVTYNKCYFLKTTYFRNTIKYYDVKNFIRGNKIEIFKNSIRIVAKNSILEEVKIGSNPFFIKFN